jgi:molecular chaperone DnaJ
LAGGSPAAGAGGGGFGFPGGFGGGGGTTAGGFDISDLFGNLFGGGGGARSGTRRAARGADLETEATIDFAEAVDGTTVALRMSSDAACPTCHGTGGKPGTTPHVCPTCDGAGMVISSVGGGAFSMNETCPECHGRQLIYDEACPTCHGSGRGRSSRTLQVRIPAGVKGGQRIRLKGKGAPGDNGGPAGDLYVTVHVRHHPLFGRKGDNLTLAAPVTLRIPAGTPNGRVLRVRGRGAPRKDGSKGDLLVTVDVQVPTQLDDEARAALTAYAEATAGADPRADLLRQGVS